MIKKLLLLFIQFHYTISLQCYHMNKHGLSKPTTCKGYCASISALIANGHEAEVNYCIPEKMCLATLSTIALERMGANICKGLSESTGDPGTITRCKAAVCQSDNCNNYNFRTSKTLNDCQIAQCSGAPCYITGRARDATEPRMSASPTTEQVSDGSTATPPTITKFPLKTASTTQKPVTDKPEQDYKTTDDTEISTVETLEARDPASREPKYSTTPEAQPEDPETSATEDNTPTQTANFTKIEEASASEKYSTNTKNTTIEVEVSTKTKEVTSDAKKYTIKTENITTESIPKTTTKIDIVTSTSKISETEPQSGKESEITSPHDDTAVSDVSKTTKPAELPGVPTEREHHTTGADILTTDIFVTEKLSPAPVLPDSKQEEKEYVIVTDDSEITIINNAVSDEPEKDVLEENNISNDVFERTRAVKVDSSSSNLTLHTCITLISVVLHLT